MKPRLKKAKNDLEKLARDLGLDFIPVIFETVTRDIMLEACSYGLPVRARHWSYGATYDHQKLYGEMGLSKVFEIVFNNNPSYAFLLDTNPDSINIMVMAHVYGHSHFFKNNYMFRNSDRNMIFKAAERAKRVDQYIEQHGLDKIEHLMDMCFALDRHIDWHKGVHRKKYPKKRIVEEKVHKTGFEDLLNINNNSERSLKYRVEGEKLPPYPEKDILWFLINYAPLEEWERDVLDIMREESYYFFPIASTKIANEGFAVLVHAELMKNYDGISEKEHLDFCKCHASVVSPGNPFRINPYYLGFKILTDIRDRWDKKYKNGESDINGMQKVFKVVAEENDASLLRNYLTIDLAEEMGLFNFGYRHHRDSDEDESQIPQEYGVIELKDRDLDKIIENIIRPMLNYGVPHITINQIDGDTMVLEHNDDFGPLDEKYTEKTMEYIYELWGGPIELKTYDHDNKAIVFIYDEAGFDIL